MHRIPKLLLLLTFLILPTKTIADSKSVYDIASKSVFKITALDAFNQEIRYGFGVSIGKSKCEDAETYLSMYNSDFDKTNKEGVDILTTFHNVAFASSLFVESRGGAKVEAVIVYIDSLSNIAIIRTRNEIQCSYVTISNEINVGNKLYIYQFEGSNSETLRESYIDQITKCVHNKFEPASETQTDLIGLSGFDKAMKSGAAVFDEIGKLVGLYRGKNPLGLNDNSLINFNIQTLETIAKSKSYNIDHPRCITEKWWSIGIHYLPKHSKNIADSLKWRDRNERWLRWERIDSSLSTLSDLYNDKRLKNHKGKSTGANQYQIISDSSEILYRIRSEDFRYDIDGRFFVYDLRAQMSSESQLDLSKKLLSEIEKMQNIFGKTPFLSKMHFKNTYILYSDANFFLFKIAALDYISKCPKYSESLPLETRIEIQDFKSEIMRLPEFYNDDSSVKKDAIREIVSSFEKSGWPEGHF